MPTPRRSPHDVAVLALPRPEDLWGDGWVATTEHGDNGVGGDMTVGTDGCLPDDFPDEAVVAEAQSTLERPGSLVHAMATVFCTRADATRAWTMLAGEAFAHCFAESMAAEVDLPDGDHLLGPLSAPGDLALDRQGRRTTVHRATWSRAGNDGVVPLVLDLAVVQNQRVVVITWAVDDDRSAAEQGWPHLVERLERRAEASRALD